MFKNNDQVAILFRSIVMEDMEILVPIRTLIGTVDEKSTIFHDYVSGNNYLHTDLLIDTSCLEGFGAVQSLRKLKKDLREIKTNKAVEKYLNASKEFVFYYDDGYEIKIMPKEKFTLMTGLSVTYSNSQRNNEILADYVEGKIDDLDEALSVENQIKLTEEKEENNEKFEFNSKKISEVIKEMTKSIVSQDEAIKSIITSIYKSKYFGDKSLKSNIFIYGPTGVGKTLTFQLLGKKFGCPVLIEDLTRYTIAGYKGSDVENILANLFYNAQCNLDLAQKSILVLDEIDKKAEKKGDTSSIATDGVLKSLLKIIEGGKFDVELSHGQKITFDTSELIVVVSGAFTDLFEKKVESKIGFGERTTYKTQQNLRMEEFVRYGMPREFMGRFDVIVKFNQLGYEEYLQILKSSDISPLKVYLDSFEKLGVEIKEKDKLCELIAKKALKYNTGARALKLVVDEMFSEVLYSVFDNPEETMQIELDENIVDNPSLFKLVKKEKTE